METNKLPAKISYNKADVKSIAAELVWADGAVVKLVILKNSVKPFSKPAKNGKGEDLGFSMRIAVVDPTDDISLMKVPTLWHRVTLPIPHPDYPEHEPPTGAKGYWKEFCRAFLGERHPSPPKREQGVLVFEGDEIEQADIDTIKLKLADALADEACELWNVAGKELEGYFAFGTIKRRPPWTNIGQLRSELRDGETLTPKEDLLVDEDMNTGDDED